MGFFKRNVKGDRKTHITLDDGADKFGVRIKDDHMAVLGVYEGDTLIVERSEDIVPGRFHAMFLGERGLVVRMVEECEGDHDGASEEQYYQLSLAGIPADPCATAEQFTVMGHVVGIRYGERPLTDRGFGRVSHYPGTIAEARAELSRLIARRLDKN
jgi:hypothetical protein